MCRLLPFPKSSFKPLCRKLTITHRCVTRDASYCQEKYYIFAYVVSRQRFCVIPSEGCRSRRTPASAMRTQDCLFDARQVANSDSYSSHPAKSSHDGFTDSMSWIFCRVSNSSVVFPSDSIGRSCEFLEPNEPVDIVARGESSTFLHLVLVNSADQIIRHSNVDSARETRHDVHKIGACCWHHSRFGRLLRAARKPGSLDSGNLRSG